MTTTHFYLKRFSAFLLHLTTALVVAATCATASATPPTGEMEKVVSIVFTQGQNIHTRLNDLSRQICRTEHAANNGFMTGYQILQWEHPDMTLRMRYRCIW